MGTKYENDFKVMIVELLKSGRTAKELSIEYAINSGIRRYQRGQMYFPHLKCL